MTTSTSFPGIADQGHVNTNAEWKAMVIRFYETYNPEKLKDVDEIMAEFEGREVELFQELVNKYNVYTQVVVNEVSDTPPASHTLSNSAGQSWNAGPPAFSERSSSRGSAMSDGLRSRLLRLKQQNPHSDEGELMIAAAEQQRSWRNAIIKFYQEYQPSKLANISEIFNECDGEEELLYNLIVSKYKKSVANNPPKSQLAAPKAQRNAVTQCNPTGNNVTLPTTPLTTQLDITGGEIVGVEDINDQLEWSVLVVLEQEERMRGILSKLTLKGGDPHLIKETSERLLSIQKEANAIRKLFDARGTPVTPSKTVTISSGSLPPPPVIGSGIGNFRDRASTSPPMATPSSFAVPLGTSTPFVRRRSVSSSPSLQRHLISPPAPLPTNTLGVNTQALIDAVSALQKKGVTMPSPQELRVR
eukprot:TRINITY_DN18312_c0_g1_i1.p1 TRINITY_DN18312_c0_g1~~TRINITY_DN18312_c0_g1_i1.p1  ORF type:complete len:416 (+),score=75.11 TRINITY_DN18312_c0_g1_i1:53-1300(+)